MPLPRAVLSSRRSSFRVGERCTWRCKERPRPLSLLPLQHSLAARTTPPLPACLPAAIPTPESRACASMHRTNSPRAWGAHPAPGPPYPPCSFMVRCPLEEGGQALLPEDCPGRMRRGDPCPGGKFSKVRGWEGGCALPCRLHFGLGWAGGSLQGWPCSAGAAAPDARAGSSRRVQGTWVGPAGNARPART